MSGNWMNEWEAERIEYDFDLPQNAQTESADKTGLKPETSLKNPALPGFESVVSLQNGSVSPKAENTVPEKNTETDRQMNFEALLFAAHQKSR